MQAAMAGQEKSRAAGLPFPVLCLTRQMGVCIAGTAEDLGRCSASVFWRGRFFEGLRLVDATGQTHEVIRATIRRPARRAGQRLARLLDLTMSVEVETRSTGAASVDEIRRIMEQAVDDDAEAFEEFSGRDVEWWRRTLAASQTVEDLMRTLEALRRGKQRGDS
jgi:hypothetical protein